MVDLHCHILPYVDDGPQSIGEFINMANIAVSSGIYHLFATPHHLNGTYENTKFKILDYVTKLNCILSEENTPLYIHPGQELMIHRELFISLEKDEVLTLGNKGKYLLLELPSDGVPLYTHDIVYELLIKGITPIIVHPERNKGFIENDKLLFELVREGALTQITAGSLLGQFGKRVRNFTKDIVSHQLTHFVATDAHNITSRGFYLHEAYEMISKIFGIHYTLYLRENAELLLNEENLRIDDPIPIKKKTWGIF